MLREVAFVFPESSRIWLTVEVGVVSAHFSVPERPEYIFFMISKPHSLYLAIFFHHSSISFHFTGTWKTFSARIQLTAISVPRNLILCGVPAVFANCRVNATFKNSACVLLWNWKSPAQLWDFLTAAQESRGWAVWVQSAAFLSRQTAQALPACHLRGDTHDIKSGRFAALQRK